MTKDKFSIILNDDIQFINLKLSSYLNGFKCPSEIIEAMRYSIDNGGKRVRPVLCIEFAKALGCDKDNAANFACAVEFIHTYSLIHDDLPCMDNDDMRRGKPSCHKYFNEALALLAGDGLLTEAFGLIAKAPLAPEKCTKAIEVLSRYSGISGMVGGQVLDLKYESGKPSADELLQMYEMKTGDLIICACELGCIAAGADEYQIQKAREYAVSLGLAFQIQDDILDIIGDGEQIGKPVGSDEKNNKVTFASLLGVEDAKKVAERYTNAALEALNAFENSDFMKAFALALLSRNK